MNYIRIFAINTLFTNCDNITRCARQVPLQKKVFRQLGYVMLILAGFGCNKRPEINAVPVINLPDRIIIRLLAVKDLGRSHEQVIEVRKEDVTRIYKMIKPTIIDPVVNIHNIGFLIQFAEATLKYDDGSVVVIKIWDKGSNPLLVSLGNNVFFIAEGGSTIDGMGELVRTLEAGIPKKVPKK